MYYVYIIYSVCIKRKYIGYTSDLLNRIKEHNRKDSKYTTKGIPWKLIYYEAFINKKDAQAEERFLKTGKGRERLKYLLNNSFGELAESG